MEQENTQERFCFHDVRAFKSIGYDGSEIIVLQGYTFCWTVIAAGTLTEAVNQSLNIFRSTPLLSAKGEILLGNDLRHHIKSMIGDTPITTGKIINYPLYPFSDKKQESPVTAAIETFFPEDEFMYGMRIGATALEIHDIRIFQETLIAELQKINRDWFCLSKEQAADIISAALCNPDFHSELFRDTIPVAWNAR